MWMSDASHFHEHADDLCVIKSMHTDQFNHAPAELFVHTGFPQPGRPSFGAWTTYGLGSENPSCPATLFYSAAPNPTGKILARASFPGLSGRTVPIQGRFRALRFRSAEDEPRLAAGQLDALRDLNHQAAERFAHPETLTRIAQYELAYRMQTSVPEVMDISGIPRPSTPGAEVGGPARATIACLPVGWRKRVSASSSFSIGAGTFTNQSQGGYPGRVDHQMCHHGQAHTLIKDLKERGLFDETLIIIGGEFDALLREGRTSKELLGRDLPDCYTMLWRGVAEGRTRDGDPTNLIGVARDPVHVHDLQATWMHLLGFDHEQLTYRLGRDYRLTGVHGLAVKDLIA